MIAWFRQRPFATSIFIVLIYGISFIVPVIVKGIPQDAHGIAGIKNVIKLLPGEAIDALVVAVFVSILGWWHQIGFVRPNRGSIKFIIPILLLIMVIFGLSLVADEGKSWFLGFDSPAQLTKMFLVILLIGFVEESIFRGILLHGLRVRYSIFWSIFISAIIFGSFHFVNILAGADKVSTIYQAIHAASMGFLYGSLRVKIGAIWPLMIVHGLWDMSLFVLQTTSKHLAPETMPDPSVIGGLSVSIPALLYGIFVYWRLSKHPGGAR